MNDPDTEATLSRRRLLRTTGAGIAGLTATSTLAGAQEDNDSGNGSGTQSDDGSLRIQTRGIMPETGRVTKDSDYTGFLVQLTNRLEDTQVASGDLQCSFANWSPENTTVYETQLIDRVDQETESIASVIYLPSDVDLRSGDVLIINKQHNCSGAYIGVRLENILASDRTRGYVEAGLAQNGSALDGGQSPGSSGAFGPGFGPLAAVGGLAGGAYALARRGDDE